MNLNKKTLDDINVAGKRVLIRVDFNVPQDKEGKDVANGLECIGSLCFCFDRNNLKT
jgi:3-phosphoglycerate kinase